MNLAPPQSAFTPSRDVRVGSRPSWVNIIKRALVIIAVDIVGDAVSPASVCSGGCGIWRCNRHDNGVSR